MHAHRIALLSLSCLLVAACGGDKAGTASRQAGEDTLPKPDAVAGSVTGMPDPGVAGVQPVATVQVPDIIEIPDPAAGGEAVAIDTPPVDEPADAQAAIAVVRTYYAAINAGDFGSAYAQWSDGGRASGQSPDQFASGFAATAGVSVQVGAPGRIEGAAGSRFVELPITLEARQVDGSLRRYGGRYTLRRSVVDGATPEQQSWRIASADLRELP